MEHNGQTYEEKQEGEARVNWIAERFRPNGKVDYRYELEGAHHGPKIEVWMLGFEIEYDEYGQCPGWDALAWADDETPFDDDYFLDAYTDPLCDDLRQMLNQ